MKKIIIFFVSIFFLSSFCAVAENKKIGIIDYNKIISESKKAKTGMEKIANKFKPELEKIISDKDKFKKIENDFENSFMSMDDEEKDKIKNEILINRNLLSTNYQKYQEKVVAAQEKLLMSLKNEINKHIKEISLKDGFKLVIIKDAVPYYDSDIVDITDIVFKLMNY